MKCFVRVNEVKSPAESSIAINLASNGCVYATYLVAPGADGVLKNIAAIKQLVTSIYGMCDFEHTGNHPDLVHCIDVYTSAANALAASMASVKLIPSYGDPTGRAVYAVDRDPRLSCGITKAGRELCDTIVGGLMLHRERGYAMPNLTPQGYDERADLVAYIFSSLDIRLTENLFMYVLMELKKRLAE